MKLEKTLIPPLCWAILTAAFAWAAYKAAADSFTVDESFTYLQWVGAPFSNFTTFFEANNHPLNTLLCRVSVAIFGLSELSMRLPSLLSSILYFAAIYRITMLAFGATAWTLLTVALACANPLVLDHFATARGYGMGIAFWTAGTWLTLRAMSGRQSNGLSFLAGTFLGLSCCSYLTEVYAVVALATAVAIFAFTTHAFHPGWRGSISFSVPLAGGLAMAAWYAAHIPLEAGIHGERVFRHGVELFLDAMINYHRGPWSSRFGWLVSSKSLWIGILVFSCCCSLGA